jgi:hypothetical protein
MLRYVYKLILERHMPRNGVQYEDVVAVAQELSQEGINVTHEQVRMRLGTGSNSTLGKHLKRWRENDLDKQDEDLSSTLSNHVKLVWNKLADSADSKIISILLMAQLVIEKASEENLKLRDNNRRWQNLYETWIVDKRNLSQKLEQLENSREEQYQLSQKLQLDKNILQVSITEKEAHITSLQNNLNQAQKSLEHFREATREQSLIDQDRQVQGFKTIKTLVNTHTKQILQTIVLDNDLQSHISNQLAQLQDVKFSHDNALRETNEMLYALKRSISKIQLQISNALPKSNSKRIKNKFLL